MEDNVRVVDLARKARKPSRPTDAQIIRVLEYIGTLGLYVYGQNTNLETGQEFPSQRDFRAADVCKYREIVLAGRLWHECQECDGVGSFVRRNKTIQCRGCDGTGEIRS